MCEDKKSEVHVQNLVSLSLARFSPKLCLNAKEYLV